MLLTNVQKTKYFVGNGGKSLYYTEIWQHIYSTMNQLKIIWLLRQEVTTPCVNFSITRIKKSKAYTHYKFPSKWMNTLRETKVCNMCPQTTCHVRLLGTKFHVSKTHLNNELSCKVSSWKVAV